MAVSTVRVPGGGNTFVTISAGNVKDKSIDLVSSFTDTPGAATAQPAQIHPIGYEHPMEIVTAYAQTAGTITLDIWAVWGQDAWVTPFEPMWQTITSGIYTNDANFDGKNPTNLIGVLQGQRAAGGVTLKKWELAANGYDIARVRTYKNCVITDIQARETVSNNSMPETVTVTIMYTHSTVSRPGGKAKRLKFTD